MRKQRRQSKIEIFKLEDRVLFEAAGAAEAVEAVDNANSPNPDQQRDVSESERQEKEAQSAAKHAGPDGAAVREPGAPVQEQGAGLAQPGTAQQDPVQKLVEGSADFSDVPDVAEQPASDVSNFLNADFSEHSVSKLSFSDSLSADGHDLIIVDAETAKKLDADALPDNTEVLVLDRDSDAMEQINAYLDSRDGKFDSIKFVVDAEHSEANSGQEQLELNGEEISSADLNAIREHIADHGDLSVQLSPDDSAPSYSLNPDGDFESRIDSDPHDTVIHPEIDGDITVDSDLGEQLDSALANSVEEGRNELVIINGNMADKDTVLSQLGDGYEVLEIDPSQDAMSQIQDYLDAHSDTKYDAVHILTHGNDQGFYLGSTKVTSADQMAVFNGHMADNGDFMLYGCNLASTEHGQSLVQDIADFTGCDVAASSDITGISGDWALEYNVGVVDTANISVRGWNHDLATITVNNQSDWENYVLNGNLSDSDTIEFNASGNYQINQDFSIDADITISVSNNADVTITVADGVTFDVNGSVSVTDVTFVNHGTFNINAGGALNISNTAASGDVHVIENTGTLSIAGVLTVNGNPAGSGGTLTAVYNNGSGALVTVAETGSLTMNADSRVAYGLWNHVGSVNVTGGTVSLTNASGANSATIRNDYTGSNSVEISNASRIAMTANAGVNAYAISNNDRLDIENSFVAASGSDSIGLFNNTNGNATFTVSENPDGAITASDLAGYGAQVYGIIGGAYSVYNYSAFTMTTTLDSARYTGGNLNNAPVMYLGGNVYTEAQGGSRKTTTILNGATVNGDITNVSSTTLVLNDVYLNGNISNMGGNVYVTGDFFSPTFTVGGNTIAGTSRITVENTVYAPTRSYGNIYFGTALASSGYGDNSVTFRADQGYSFENYGGQMRIVNFASLSSVSNPISIFNSGEFYLDATNAQGLASNGAYDLYVSYYGSESVENGLNISDAGIYNYNQNAFNPLYFVPNAMELTNLNIRNTQANSVAVTNNSGTLTVTGGSLQGTYSGLDALSDFIISGSWQTHDIVITVYTPVTTLTDVEKIAGQAYSIRNTGDLTLTGENTAFGYTVLTNDLDFSAQGYSGDYMAVFNASTTVYLIEQYTSEGDAVNELAAYVVNPVQSVLSRTWAWSDKSAASMTSGNVTVGYVSAENVYARTTFTITPSSTYSRSAGNITLTDWHFGNYQVMANMNLDYVAFQADGTTATTTALGNWGNLIVSNINNDPAYQLSGFTVSLNNGHYSSGGNMYFWASDYAAGRSDALRNPLWETGQNYTSGLYSSASVSADLTVDFDLQAGKLWTVNDTLVGSITLRGVKASADSADYEYNGRLIISGAAFTIDYGKTLNLENFSVLGVDGNGLVNYGKLGVYNGESLGNGGWRGGSNAYIEATNGIAIENHGTVRLINGAVLNSRIGIYNEADAGILTIINSTLSGNSEWAIVSNRSGDTAENGVNFVVADTTIANNGNGIQVNNGGLLHLVNSIVLNHGGTDIALNGGSSLYSATAASNIYGGKDGKDTDTWSNEVFGTTNPTLSNGNVFVLAENSAALTGGIAFSYTVGSDGLYTYSFGSTDGEINVTWDKLGNDRTTEIGSYVLTGTPTPPTPTGEIIVNTTEDYTGTITVDSIVAKLKDADSEYSLREVIWAIQHQAEIGEALGYEFVLDNTVEFADSLGTDFSLTVTAGTIDISGNITINIDIPAGYTVTIDASANQGESAFTVSGNGELNLGNLTIQGDATGNAERGAAISILGGEVTLKDVAVLNGIAASGGAIYVANGGTLNVEGGRFEKNRATDNGGAIYVASGGSLNISASVEFEGNTAAGNGGAIYNDGVVVLNGETTFSGNEAASGGAVYNHNTVQVNGDVTFTGNHAVNGSGGAIYNDGGSLNIAGGGTFDSNTATENGGSIYNSGDLTVSNSSFTGTGSGDALNGGAIYSTGDLTLENSSFSGFHAEGDGGAVYAAGDLTINGDSNVFADNSAEGDGGAIYAGGNLSLTGNAEFTSNVAGGDGGAVYAGGNLSLTGNAEFASNAAGGDGGAIYSVANVMLDGGAVFTNNRSEGDGGAVYAEGSVTLDGSSVFTSNTAGGDGGAIYAVDGISLTGNAEFTNNRAEGDGGAIVSGADIELSGALVLNNNSAGGNGGAVYVDGNVTVSGLDFTGNEAGGEGAAIYATGNLTLTDSSFSGNGNASAKSIVYAGGGKAVLNNVKMFGNMTDTADGVILNVQNADVKVENSAFYNNTAANVLSVGASLYLISSTVAQGTGTISRSLISGKGDMTILSSTLTGNSSDALVLGNGSGELRIVNSILVGESAGQRVADGFATVGAAYSIFSGSASQLNGVNDQNSFNTSYAEMFGNNGVSADGTIKLVDNSKAQIGVWVGYNDNGDLWYSVRPDQLYPRYSMDTVSWKQFGSSGISQGRPGGMTIVSKGLNGGTLPSIGSYWAPQSVPTLGIGPGVNNTFIDPSYNGIGWNNNDIYNVVADSLLMNPGFFVNFRNEMPAGGRWYYDFTHAFDDRYSTMNQFGVTLGRFDLGFVPSGENYISINVNGDVSDDFTRYTTTPYFSDGTPLIPEELESMNSETTAPATDGSFDLPEGLEEKVISYLGRAEIFKNDFDKALDQLLAVNV